MPRLSKRFIDSLEPTEKDLIIFDDEMPGYGVRVKSSGRKSYVIRYRQNGRSRSFTFAKVGILTPEQARKQARIILGDIARGGNPSEERHREYSSPRLTDLASEYLDRHAIPKKRPSSVRNDKLLLRTYILPAIGQMKVTDVSRRDIEKLHLSLARHPYQANRLLALLSKMLSLAVSWEWRQSNPVIGLQRFQEIPRQRWLNEDELARLMEVLQDFEHQGIAQAIQLLVLTGARKGEVLNATWDQFDLTNGVWTKPAHTTKQKRMVHLPLSDETIELLLSIRSKADTTSRYLFPGRTSGDQPLKDVKKSWRTITERADLPNTRLHDLRHTHAGHLVSSGVSLAIVGRMLGHTQAQTTQRYAHLADSALREASNLFAKKVTRTTN